jgi:TPR repeat protein
MLGNKWMNYGADAFRISVLSIASVVLVGCGTTPVEHDQAIVLAPNQGIAAIVTDLGEDITQVHIEPAPDSLGKTLLIPDVAYGPQIYLFPTEAGTYCFMSFNQGRSRYFPTGSDGGCFEVHAGTISLTSTFAPSGGIIPLGGWSSFDPKDLLRKKYPVVAQQFPLYTGNMVERAPAAPNPLGARLLAQRIEDRVGAAPDYDAAIHWWREAAKQGDVVAQDHLLYGLYLKGLGIPDNPNAQLQWFLDAAAQGYPDAQVALGYFYQVGNLVAQDNAEAMQWYAKAAEHDYAQAKDFIGNLYYQGAGVPQSYTQAIDWWRKAAALHYAKAERDIGAVYRDGQGVPVDYAQAASWFRKAADDGIGHPFCELVVMHEKGQASPLNDEEARNWQQALDTDSSCINDVAWYLATTPDANKRDGNRAISLMKKIIDKNDKRPSQLDTLAVAYAATGDFDNAVKIEQDAIRLQETLPPTDSAWVMADLRKHLAVFEKKQPYIDN